MTETATAPATGDLFKALAQLQAELPKVGKSAKNQFGRYADLADVSQEVLPRLGRLGLVFTAKPTLLNDKFVLAYSLVHVSGEREDGIYPLASNGTPQQMGSAITYARRYCLCAVTGVAPDEDDDDAAAAQDGARQSAGDVFENSTPARPSRPAQQQRPRAVRPAEAVAPPDDRPWADQAIERAASLKSERAGTRLWEEAAARGRDGSITREDAGKIQGLITAQVEHIREQAFQAAMQQLSADDSWRPKLEELSKGGQVEDARAALEELGRLVADGTIDKTRGNRISRAIVAKFPRAERGQVAS